jgi:hypothetical protein
VSERGTEQSSLPVSRLEGDFVAWQETEPAVTTKAVPGIFRVGHALTGGTAVAFEGGVSPSNKENFFMHKTSLFLATALLAACTAPDPSIERTVSKAARPPGAGGIESVSYVGTGCGAGTTHDISDDKQAITTIYSQFVASAGPSDDPANATKNCLTMMQIDVPAGWQYSIETAVDRGFVGIERDVTATRQSVYVISGNPVFVPPTARFKGEKNDEYEMIDVSADKPGAWSACGGGQALWIATQVEVKSANRQRGGQITVDSSDAELQWRRCQ